MTLEEFEEQYAKNSGVTVEWLHEQNQHGVPCDCGLDGCQGWRMMTISEAIEDRTELT